MTKRGRKRVEHLYTLYDPDDGKLLLDTVGETVLDTSKERLRQRFDGGVPVRLTIEWEEPPRKEKR